MFLSFREAGLGVRDFNISQSALRNDFLRFGGVGTSRMLSQFCILWCLMAYVVFFVLGFAGRSKRSFSKESLFLCSESNAFWVFSLDSLQVSKSHLL